MQSQFKSISLSERANIAAAIAIFFATMLGAQTLEDVVVTASRSAQRSFDAPAAIQSVDRSVIEQGGPQVNLSESLNRVPGLTIQVSIRGFGASSPFGIRGVRLLVDGIPATTPDGQGQGSRVGQPDFDRAHGGVARPVGADVWQLVWRRDPGLHPLCARDTRI
jgi:iron complex outermembrane receptor protein